MYGKPACALGATCYAMLPNTGSNKLLFVVATGLLVSGVVVLIASFVAGRKSRVSEAN
jgi:LPXTG-motif cell wall-anchored protein